MVAGLAAKIAGDVVLLAQTEVAEVAEGGAGGTGSSSAMPQKRNPVSAVSAIAAARLAQRADDSCQLSGRCVELIGERTDLRVTVRKELV